MKKVRALFFLALGFILAPLFVLMRIKIVLIQTERIGGLALDCETFLRRKKLKQIKEKYRYVFISGPDISNQFLFKKYKQLLNIRSSKILNAIATQCERTQPRFFYNDPEKDRSYDVYNNTGQFIKFKEDELKLGFSVLNAMGIDQDKDKFVCLFSRDSAYLKKTYPSKDWSYHDYRNIDIDTFELAVKSLIDDGYYVIRVGNIVEKPLTLKHERLIDYPYTKYCSDFMDVFLMAHCYFVLGTESGCTDLAKIFDTPSLIVNYSRLGAAPWGKKSLYTPAKIRSSDDKKVLTFRQVLDFELDNVQSSDILHKLGFELEKNTEIEILEATQEMQLRLNTQSDWLAEDKLYQERFYESFRSKTECSNIKTPISTSFLKRNESILLPSEAIH